MPFDRTRQLRAHPPILFFALIPDCSLCVCVCVRLFLLENRFVVRRVRVLNIYLIPVCR